jgi:hypothetical protein
MGSSLRAETILSPYGSIQCSISLVPESAPIQSLTELLGMDKSRPPASRSNFLRKMGKKMRFFQRLLEEAGF